MIKKWLQAALDLFWPPVCATCPRPLPLRDDQGDPAAHFCPECLATVARMPAAACPLCARPFYNTASHVCGDCLKNPPPYAARSALIYQGAVAHSIARLKYKGDLSQVPTLAALAAPALVQPLAPSEPIDAIIPLPLSPRRLAQRGFNQATELARTLYRPWRAKMARIDERLLARPADGDLHLAGLSGASRRQAIRGCFQAPAPSLIQGASLLLFDDVLTTGATAGEAARTLLEAGAGRVTLATVARAVMRGWQ
ncbi:MAG: double zinc ribbon domain-containing protein [Candidatus Adiutrix sp.]|jgi:ComF family protein|nr:double zinc ribbon domain-containing protein [Candidatus Adiutrix sp.]